jgi:hypothetical protein
MPEFHVSSKRIVYTKFAALALTILLAGRIMLSDPNVVYRYIGTLAFIGFNIRAMMLAVYIQYRGKHGWGSTVDIPDNH